MGILEKLKGTPKWKHPDITVRLEGLREVDDPAIFAEVAQDDTEAKVRRAAIVRVDDIAVLSRAAANDADEDVRDRATDRLLAFAVGSVTPSDATAAEQTALDAVAGLTDSRRLSTVAKTAASAAVRQAALARVADTRALGSIARHAKDAEIAGAAFARLTDRDEMTNVAINGEHKDLALAAFERVSDGPADRAFLEMVEARAQQKAVAKRARALIQQMDEAEAAEKAAAEERALHERQIIDAIDQIAKHESSWERGTSELARLSSVWQSLQGIGAEAAKQFETSVGHAEAAIAARRRESEEAAERGRVKAEALATREALCVRVETLDGDHAIEQLNAIEEEWRSLAPLVGNGPEASRLAERFVVAVAACRTRHELGAQLNETRSKLDALVVEAEALPLSEETTSAAERWRTLVREARGLATVLGNAARPAADLTARLDVVAAHFAARDNASKEAEDKARQDLLARFQRMADRAKRVADADTITLREGERLMKDVRAAIDEASAQDRKEFNEAAATLRSIMERVAPRVKDLREMDDWRRFANQQQQDRLILEAETLVAKLAMEEQKGETSDLATAARQLRDFHAKWKASAEAPRDQAQRLWERFRTATDLIRLRCETYFKQMREQRAAGIAARTALVEEAEALAASTDWVKAATRFQELQEAWQQAGPAAKDENRDLMRRFRAASNTFFLRRREDLTTRKKVWGENQAKKEALCARAEELAQSTEWDAASSEMKKLQAEWKTVGPLRRAKSEALWTRFRAAADLFFERYHRRHEIALAGKVAEREAWVAELEALGAAGGDTAPEGIVEKVQTLRTTWNRAVPIPSNDFKLLTDRWHKALSATVTAWPDAFRGTELDPSASLQRMEKLVVKVETLLEGLAKNEPKVKGGLSQTELLAAKLRSAFATNAMGKATSDDAKWRSAGDAVKDAQASWQRLPPVAGTAASEDAAKLEARFSAACRKVMDLVRRHAPPSTSSKRPARSAGSTAAPAAV
jgi:hypothetical protein